MSAILNFDFQKRKQLLFSEVNYLNYTKKDQILHVTTTFSLKQGETRTSSGPIPPLKEANQNQYINNSNLTILHLLLDDVMYVRHSK